jgi:hypothetical protein
VPDCPGFGVNVDLVSLQRHLAIRHLHYLRVEQWRDDVAWRAWNGHIKQPRLTKERPIRSALGPILDNKIARIAGFAYTLVPSSVSPVRNNL